MLALCREHRLEHRTKHIALRYFLARELQQRGQLRLAYVASEANTADIFTKALAPGDHQRFCTMLACFALLDWSCFPTCTQLILLVQSFLFLHTVHQLCEWYTGRGRSGGAGPCTYLRVPPDPGTVAAALGASAAAALGASASAAPGAGTSPLSGTAPTESFHTFTLDSGASRSFFRDSTTLTLFSRPVAVSLADPSWGPVLAHSSTILPCPAAPSGLLSGLHLPSFSKNLVSGADLLDAWVDQFTPGGQRVIHCTCSRTGRHQATFTRRPGSSLYTLTTAPPPVSAFGQVAASSEVFAAASRTIPASAPCLCCPLAHETLLWHQRLGHPSLPRLRGMASRALVSGLPRSLPPRSPGPAPTCVPCVEGRHRAAPHSSSFPPTEAPLQTLHMDVWGPARVRGQGHERYFLLVLDDYSRYTSLPLAQQGGGEFSSDLVRAFCRLEGIRQTFTLPASSKKNGIAERRIGMVMGVAPFVRDTSADKLSSRAVPCVFLGFPPDAPGWQFYHPTSRRVLSSKDVTFDASVSYYRLFPYRTTSPPPPPLFLAPGTPLVDPLSPQGPAPSGVSQVDLTEPVEVAVDSGAARGAETGGAESGGAETGGAESGGALAAGGAGGATGAAGGDAGAGAAGGAAGAVVVGGAPGATGGAGATGGCAGAGATGGAAGAGAAGGAAGAVGARGATRATGGAGAAGGCTGAGAAGDAAGTGYPGAEGTGSVSAVSRGAARPRPYYVPLLQQVLGSTPSPGPPPPFVSPPPVQSQSQLQPAPPLPGPSPYSGPTKGLTERREPESRPVSPASHSASLVHTVRPGRVSRPRLPPGPGTHSMTLRPSTASQRLPLPSPPASSFPDGPDPESDSLRAASPTVTRFLATAVTDPLFESFAASALVAELVDIAAACRLDCATSLVAPSASVCPPSVAGECALSTDVLEDRQEDLECFAAASHHLVSMLLAPEGDPDALDIPTLRSYAEAIEGPYSSQLQAAMDAEMASWKSTGTYVHEVSPPGANIVTGMRIFRGVDFVQTFSSTPKMTTLRVLLHIAAQRDYELHSLDFSTTFLQGSLHEEIWLRRPPGFTGSFPAGTQWSLRRPVYGLRQAPREWHDTLRSTLAALGFVPSTADPSLFLRTDTTLQLFYVLVYVDDLVFATADMEALAHVKSELQKRRTCTDLGELTSYLGLRITRDRAQRSITLTQSHMVQQVLQRFGFTYSSPESTPLPTGHSLSAPPSDESVEPSGPYPELVGCLMYLMTWTRPDLAYPLSLVARYVAPGKHRKVHWDAAKRVLRYLCSTSGMGLVLGGRARVVLTGHADASWVDDLATQRLSQGYTFSLGSGSVSWRSTRSSSVLSSSCEAEIYAGAMAAQELRWLTYLLTDLGEAPCSPPANTPDVFTKALQPCDHQPCFAFLDWSCDLLFSPTLPMGWHDTLRMNLASLGFAPSTADPSLFLRTDATLPPFYVLVYVNDLVFATAVTEALAHVRSELQKRHTCIDLGELTSYLGFQITRDRAQRTITLTQSHMVQQVLQRFGFTYSSPQSTPLPTGHSLSAPPSEESVEPSGPTSGMGLVLGGRARVVLTGHADASRVDDLATQQSSQGYTFSLGSGCVSWRSTRSSSVLSSSFEAEIYAGAMAAQELRWLTYLLTDLEEAPCSPPVLYINNKAMLAFCQEHRLEHRTKHIALCYFLARELQQRGQLRLAYIASRANTTDVFTKALQPCDRQHFCTVLGLVPTVPHLLTS
ncbi:unnamed protein product [Closterium sp. NIES-53]